MKIGLAQMDIIWEDKEQNYKKAEGFFAQAAEQQVDLLLFPEMSMTGFSMNTGEIAESSNHNRTTEYFRMLSKQYGTASGVGYAWAENGHVTNRYSVLDRQGELKLTYDKIHPFSFGVESRHYKGGEQVVVTELEGVSISVFICYDLRFPEIFQHASKQADLIIVPANWPEARQEHWDLLLRARALENQCYIAGVNRAGCDKWLNYPGGSAVISPYGEVLTAYSMEETLVTAEINEACVKKYRDDFPLKKDRKEYLYKKW